MGRRQLVLGAVLGLLLGSLTTLTAQPFPANIAQAIALLTSGTTPFTIVGIVSNGYINWGSGRSASGYGIRDSGGIIQSKNLNGTWAPLSSSGGAPSTATYITQTPDASLSAEQALSSLASSLLVNTTGTGVLSAYAGTSCTNQFLRALSGLGVGTCASVTLTTDVTGALPVANGGTATASYTIGDLLQATATTTLTKLAAVATGNVLISGGVATASTWGKVGLTTHVSGTLPVANGGTNLTSGTSGGILGYTAPGTLASSIALTNHAIVLGRGAGATPVVLGSLGTANTLLHGAAAGDPTFSAVDISADTTGTLTVARGGTNIASYSVGDLLQATGTTTLAALADVAAGHWLRSGGVTTAVAWSTTTLPNTATTGDLLYASGANTYANLNDVAVGSYLRSGGAGAVPVWSTLILPNAGTIGDIPIASSANTMTMLADVAVGRVLISGGVGVIPAWSTAPTAVSFTASSFMQVPEVAFGSLPGAPATGYVANVSDSNTSTWGANAAAGGANHIAVRWNGTNWTVVGK